MQNYRTSPLAPPPLPPPPTKIDRRAAADSMTSAHGSRPRSSLFRIIHVP